MKPRLALCLIAILLFGIAARAADQKLILKDGTDQRVSSWERQGDRIRFFSTERQEFEEIPESLVDWKATEEAEQEAKKAADEAAAAFAVKRAASPRFQVAPGVALPGSEGAYVYDGKNLLALLQSQATIRNDRARQIVGTLAPVVSGRAFVELEGIAAKVAVTGASPVFFLRLSQVSPAGYALVRVIPKDGARIVGEIQIKAFSKSQSEKQQIIPVTSQKVKQEIGDLNSIFRLTPDEPLRPGEYAVVEYAEKGKMNLFVWDFGYHPDTGGQKPR